MINEEIRTLHAADGTPVCNLSFDLSAAQLSAAAQAVEAIRLERHRHLELSTDDVLALRELTGLSDELHRLAEHGANGTVVLPLARFVALHDALAEWLQGLQERGWMREDDAAIHPLVAALVDPMASLRADALHAVLGAGAEAPGA
jgi:type II secretory pathway component PulM